MNLQEELSRFNPDPALAEWMLATLKNAEQTSQTLQQNLQIRDAELQAANIKIQATNLELHAANIKIQSLTLELAQRRRMLFGRSAEGYAGEQLELFESSAHEDIAAIEAELDNLATQLNPGQPAQTRKQRQRSGRQPLPSHLPRIEHRHEPASCDCSACGQALVKIGEDISEQLDVTPAQFFVHRHIRPQYACKACETITAEPVPAAVIDGGLAAPGLHAWVVINKFADHLPLYRIEQIAARAGVPLARSTLAQWVGQLGVALQPLADRLVHLLKQRTVLHADETPVPMLAPNSAQSTGRGGTQRAYLWAYRSTPLDTGPPIVVFDFQTSRAGKHAQSFLQDWSGHLMVDDYAGYKALFASGKVTELACLAHARRKFFELHAANQSPLAAQALEHIAQLYAIEQHATEQQLDTAVRAQYRQDHALPKLQAFHSWLLTTRSTAAPGSGLQKAIDYSLKRWPAIERYATAGHLPLDNNPIENAIRPIALGRKNWLFAGSERAGNRAAALQTLLATAKANGIEPYAWLKDTLEKLPAWPNSKIDELLPLRWA